MATRTIDDPPVGRVEQVTNVDGSVEVSGWAYDADVPEGGLSIRVWLGEGEPTIATETSGRASTQFSATCPGGQARTFAISSTTCNTRRECSVNFAS